LFPDRITFISASAGMSLWAKLLPTDCARTTLIHRAAPDLV
jgi:hypothetical protein